MVGVKGGGILDEMSVFLCASMINVTYTHREPGPVEDCGNIAQTNWDPQNVIFFKEKLLP